MLPSTSPTQLRSNAVILAEELSKAADLIRWPRMSELKEFEAITDHIIAAGYYETAKLMDTPAADRAQLFNISPGGEAGWARLLQLGRKAPQLRRKSENPPPPR